MFMNSVRAVIQMKKHLKKMLALMMRALLTVLVKGG
jgi:hypothetical protein